MSLALDARVFPAKLLLFGEHVLLLGAPALAMPVPAFGGKWIWQEVPDRHHARMIQFAQSEALQTLSELDTSSFLQDLENGLAFQSDIPTGYGLGSSGALCAAIYDRYVRAKTTDLSALKSIFAQMEGFFHGSSSGIDPLTSYTGQALLITDKTRVESASPQTWIANAPIVLLLDSRLPRRTGPLVEWFLAQSTTEPFAQILREEYLPAHSETLRAWLSADAAAFWPALQRLSALQFKHFTPMIPDTMREIWTECLGREDVVLKICGAGGGGFVLGFARDAAAAGRLSEQFPLIFPFQNTPD